MTAELRSGLHQRTHTHTHIAYSASQIPATSCKQSSPSQGRQSSALLSSALMNAYGCSLQSEAHRQQVRYEIHQLFLLQKKALQHFPLETLTRRVTNQFANTNTPLRETQGPCEYPQPYVSRMKPSISHSPQYLSIKSSKNVFSNITHTNLKQQANHIHINSIQPSILPSSSKRLLNNVHNLCLARALLPGLDNFDSSLEKIDAQIGN